MVTLRLVVRLFFFIGFFCGHGVMAADSHAIYERACAPCHAPHAGAFAETGTRLADGELIGMRSSRKVADLLADGHGRLSAEEADKLVLHITRIHNSGRLFDKKCIICHDRAVQLARIRLILRDGTLRGRYTDRDIATFLSGHGRLTPDEADLIIDVLKQHLAQDPAD
jgi:hypothetical protein